MNFNSKNGRKRNFPYETKVAISFIPMLNHEKKGNYYVNLHLYLWTDEL